MKISIAMATYSGAQYLQEQLDSIKDQTKLPDELVITDDCSTDRTEEIVLEFAKTAPFKVIFSRNSQNLGYCGNFNAALMKTSGDLVFLSDQDDVWFPEKIEHMVAVANKNPEMMIVMNDAAITDGDLNDTGLTKIGQIQAAGFGLSYFAMGCCCAVRRELLNICLPIDKGYKAHDVWLLAFAKGLDARAIEQKLLQYYRRHGKNESQIPVNGTTRVSRLDSIAYAIRNISDKNKGKKFIVSGEQKQLLLEGVQSAVKKAPNQWKSKLEALALELEKEVETHNKRADIRNKDLPTRIVLALNAYNRGDYKTGNKFKSMLRDIAG